MWKKKCMWMCVRRGGDDDDEDDASSLDYRHSSLCSVPSDVFAHERTLEELFLDSNQIRDLPRELFYCQSMRYLYVSDNELVSLPSMIGSLINLERLDISKNAIVDLPSEIGGCKLLQVLEASVNPLNRIPESMTRLVSLSELYLNDTFLEALPTNFGRLNRLRVLELRENHLQTLPNSLSALTQLQRLDLGTNDLIQLPEVIASLTSLQELWLDNNRLTSLSQVVGSLQQLTFLDASKNCIESIATEIERCINLTDLHLSTNRIQRLPESLGRLSNLLTLKLNDNALIELPFSIGGLVSLTELDISCNNLQELPIGIGLLRYLRTLYADDNFLKIVPAELGSCARLTILSFRTNNLVYIPDEIGRIPRLKVLNLSDNKLQSLPFGLIKLKELTALWLADNQTNPLLKLQTEIDRETGQRMLTCYLLPQQTAITTENGSSSSEAEDVQSNWSRGQRPQLGRHIHFEPNMLDEQGHLQRTPTPYPKELKRRLQRRREQAVNGRFDAIHQLQSIDGVVRGRRSQRQASQHSDSNESHSQITVERHVLLKAEKELLLRDKARMHSNSAPSHSGGPSNPSMLRSSQTTVNMTSPKKSVSRVSSGVADLGLAAGSRLNQSVDKQLMSETEKSLSAEGCADRRVINTYNQTTERSTRQVENKAERRPEETDLDSVGVSNHSIDRQGSKSRVKSGFDDIVNNNNGTFHQSTQAGSSRQNRDIDVMSYSEFVQSLSRRGIPPPSRVTVRRDGDAPHYVVHQQRHQRAEVRSLRRHGYDSEGGFVVNHNGRSRNHGYESDRSYSNGRQRRAPRSYDSDVGYRSDITGSHGNRAAPTSSLSSATPNGGDNNGRLYSYRPVPNSSSHSARPSGSDVTGSQGNRTVTSSSLHSATSNRGDQYVVSRNFLSPKRISEENVDFAGVDAPSIDNKISSDEWMQMTQRRGHQKNSSSEGDQVTHNRDSRAMRTAYFGETVAEPMNTRRKSRRNYEPIEL